MNPKKLFTLLFISGLFVLVLQSCTTTKKVMAPPLPSLNGTWELSYIVGPQTSLSAMYPERKPSVVFDTSTNHVGGSTGCNSYSGSYKLNGNQIDLTAPIAATKMYCLNSAVGETQFLLLLPKVDNYAIVGDELDFKRSTQTLMKFTRKM